MFLIFRRGMLILSHNQRCNRLRSFALRSIVFALTFSLVFCQPISYAQQATVLGLPKPGTMVDLSPAYVPVLVKGLRVHPENPILFDFIVDTGNSGLTSSDQRLRSESEKLIKYFLATLTIPEDDMWGNLSPYEKDRIIPQQLGQTELGRDMLAEDYVLKQLTASLIYPEKKLGKEFWNRVYSKAQELYGTSSISVNTFNKVWILPDKAAVFVRNNTAFVVESHLKVMLEEDYLSLAKHTGIQNPNRTKTNAIGNQIVREVILPELEKEVNKGKNFATLRQMFYSLILASWYKNNLKEALLNQVYANKSKISGVDLEDKTIKEQIYREYLKAYKKGVFNYIKEDIDQATQQPLPRKYFSGGLEWHVQTATITDPNNAMVVQTRAHGADGNFVNITAGVEKQTAVNPAMVVDQMKKFIKEGAAEGRNTPDELNAKKLEEKDIPGDEITAAPLVNYEYEVAQGVNDSHSIQNIVHGKVAYFKFAAGEASRLKNSLIKAGIISKEDLKKPDVMRQYLIWNFNLWDVANKVRAKLTRLEEMRAEFEAEKNKADEQKKEWEGKSDEEKATQGYKTQMDQLETKIKALDGETDDLDVIIKGFSQPNGVLGVDLSKENPSYATQMKLGVRHLMALKMGIIEEAAKIGVKPEDALKKVQLVLSVTNALKNDVAADLISLARQGVLGFQLKNIQLVVNDNIPGYKYENGELIENDLGPDMNPNPNHGFNIIYADTPSKDGIFRYDEATHDFERFHESAFDNLQAAGVETISIQRTNDMIMLVPETAVDIKTYGIYNKLHHEKGINQLIEVLNNFTGEKGGFALSSKKRAEQGLTFLAEGLAIKTKKAEEIVARVRKEYQGQGVFKDIPYNRMYHYVDLKDMRDSLKANGGVLPMSVKNDKPDKPVKGNWSPEIPTGDLTMLRGMKTMALVRKHDFMIDNDILPNDPNYRKGAATGALIHDMKQLKHLLVALGAANHMDAEAKKHPEFFPSDHAMSTKVPSAANQKNIQGGIDFNARNMQLNVGGEEIKFHFNPAMVAQFESGDFSGVVPVIIQITPIQNPLSLSGINPGKEEEALVKV